MSYLYCQINQPLSHTPRLGSFGHRCTAIRTPALCRAFTRAGEVGRLSAIRGIIDATFSFAMFNVCGGIERCTSNKAVFTTDAVIAALVEQWHQKGRGPCIIAGDSNVVFGQIFARKHFMDTNAFIDVSVHAACWGGANPAHLHVSHGCRAFEARPLCGLPCNS